MILETLTIERTAWRLRHPLDRVLTTIRTRRSRNRLGAVPAPKRLAVLQGLITKAKPQTRSHAKPHTDAVHEHEHERHHGGLSPLDTHHAQPPGPRRYGTSVTDDGG